MTACTPEEFQALRLTLTSFASAATRMPSRCRCKSTPPHADFFCIRGNEDVHEKMRKIDEPPHADFFCIRGNLGRSRMSRRSRSRLTLTSFASAATALAGNTRSPTASVISSERQSVPLRINAAPQVPAGLERLPTGACERALVAHLALPHSRSQRACFSNGGREVVGATWADKESARIFFFASQKESEATIFRQPLPASAANTGDQSPQFVMRHPPIQVPRSQKLPDPHPC